MSAEEVARLTADNRTLRNAAVHADERREAAEAKAAALIGAAGIVAREFATAHPDIRALTVALNNVITNAGALLAMKEAARELSVAEIEYRSTHDLKGDGHIETGRAWDRMRNAGYRLRAALALTDTQT
jgi:hypothetical protein